MKFTIIADSCCDLRDSEISSEKFKFVTIPLYITLDDKNFLDDEGFDTTEMIKQIKVSKKIGTACPGPERFYDEMKDSDNIICVTLGKKISGTYQCASLARTMALEKNPDKKIFILDSKTATAGFLLIVNKLMEIIEKEDYKDFDDVAEKISEYANSVKTRFILQDFGILVKTGRIGKIAGFIASVLTLRTICGDNGDGEIKMYQKIIGHKKAMETLAKCPTEKIKAEGDDIPIVITHCNNAEDASFIEKILRTLHGLKNIKTYMMR